MTENNNQDESALDTIFEIKAIVKQQTMMIELLTKNLAMINDKVNKTLFPVIDSIPMGKEVIPTPPPKPKLIPPPKPSKSLGNKSFKSPAKNIKAYGHLQDELGKNLSGVDVRILDTKNRVIKQTKTNRAGTWISFLPPGRYSVEFSMSGMMSDGRLFDLMAGQKEVEVA
jgi:hypothetical protein